MGTLNPYEVQDFLALHGASIRTFVETGTHVGTTLRLICEFGFFERVHSIELSDTLYRRAAAEFQDSNVVLHHGDSADVLKKLAREINDPTLFWLDAHWFDDQDVAVGLCPLFAELEAISSRAQADLVVIDDVHCFGEKWSNSPESDWTHIHEDSILSAIDPCRTVRHYVSGNKLVVHRRAI